MNPTRWFCTSTLCLTFLSSMALAQAPVANRQEIVRQAQKSYYSLSERGLSDFRCEVKPDWDTMYASIKTDPVGREQVLPALKQMHFQFLVGPNGAATASHQAEVPPPDHEVANRVQESATGMEQVLTGFFETWSQFMVNSTLPEPGADYRLDDQDGNYHLSFKQDASEVDIFMNHDFAITETRVNGSGVNGTVRPHFMRLAQGFVLDSYEYSSSSNSQKLTVKVKYQEIEGLNLPEFVDVSMKFPSSAVAIPLHFVSCRANKSHPR